MKNLYKILSKVSLLGLLFFVIAAPTASVYSPPLIVEESDGTPSVKGTTKLIVTNGTLSKSGSQATLDLASLATSYTITRDALGTTSTDGLVLENTTAAAAGAQQISPRVRWTGRGWKTDATAESQQVDYVAQLVPVQGAAAPQARLDFNYSINGGALQAVPTMSLLNDKVGIGALAPVAKIQIFGANSSPSFDPAIVGILRIDSASTNGLDIGSSGSAPFGVWLQAKTTTTAVGAAVYPLLLNPSGGNVGIGTMSFGTSAAKVLSFGGPATAPTTRPADVFTFYPFDVNGAGTMGLAWMSEDNGIGILGGRNGFGTVAPGQFAEFEELETITGAVTDGYAAALRLDPGYTAATALTVARHNYFDVQNPSVAGDGPAAVTDAALFRFDAAIATHKALVAAFNTTDSGAHTTAWAGGIVINVNGTLYKIPIIAY